MPAINLNAYTAFEAIREKLLNLHRKQITQESKTLMSSADNMRKIAMYHLCLGYALLLKVYTTDPLTASTDPAYWKEQTGYEELKECAAHLGVDLDAIVDNTI